MTSPAVPQWQRDRLAVLLDALDGVPVTDAERRSLTWLAGWERETVENIAAVIERVRRATSGSAAAE